MMPTPTTITIDVDLTNPGQFLACCGLLELSSRIDDQAIGWFSGDHFCLSFQGQSPLDALLQCECQPLAAVNENDADKESKSPPIRFGEPLGLVLDWWEDDQATHAGFKTWAGGQTVIGFINGMQKHIARPVKRSRDLFMVMPIKKPKPFSFDSRISRLTLLDLGFSAEGFVTAFSPAVELLALIGMQRFRPATIIERERYMFATWRTPLPVTIASAVAAGLIPTLIDCCYQFPIVIRTGDKYKAFGPATPERIFHD